MHPRMIEKKKNHKKSAPQARCFMKQNAPQARLIQQNALQAGYFDSVLLGTLSC